MRILVVSNLFPPDFMGGYELGCSNMVEALRARGHDVRVVTSASIGDTRCKGDGLDRVLHLSPIYESACMEALTPAVCRQFHLESTMLSMANLNALASVIREYEPDVVYLWNLLGLGGLGLLALLRSAGIPWVWHIMDMIPRLLCGLGGDALPEIARDYSVVGQGHYIVCSTHVATEIEAGGVDLGPRVHLIPNWVTRTLNRYEPFFRTGHLRIMNSAGILGEHKGTHILIETAARLHDMGYANFSIDIYGREDDPRYRSLIHDKEVESTISLKGSRDQPRLVELCSCYDLFVFPTWHREPFGFAPLEAAACGCVPLFTDDCGIAEWLVDGVDCLKADRTVEAFARRIAEVLSGEIDLGSIARRAQSVASRDFHLNAVAPRVEEVLERAAVEKPEPSGSVVEFQRLARLASGLLPVLLTEASP